MKGVIKIGTTKVGFLPEGSKRLIWITNVKSKIEEVYVPAHSCGFIKTYHVGNEQIYDDQTCKVKIVDKKAVITRVLRTGIPSWKIRDKWIKI